MLRRSNFCGYGVRLAPHLNENGKCHVTSNADKGENKVIIDNKTATKWLTIISWIIHSAEEWWGGRGERCFSGVICIFNCIYASCLKALSVGLICAYDFVFNIDVRCTSQKIFIFSMQHSRLVMVIDPNNDIRLNAVFANGISCIQCNICQILSSN